jgi:SPOR domain
VPYVRPHIRAGQYVCGHWRRSPGAGLGLAGGVALLAVLAALLVPLLPSPPPTRPSPARPAPAPAPRSPALQAPRTDRSHYIVQVASEQRRDQATAHTTRLRSRGFRNAGMLRSDDYRPLRPGWWVTYVGPYPATSAGKARATATQRRLPSSLVRLIH